MKTILAGVFGVLISGVLIWQAIQVRRLQAQIIQTNLAAQGIQDHLDYTIADIKKSFGIVISGMNTNIAASAALCELHAAEDRIQHAQDYPSIYQFESLSNKVSWLQDQVSEDEKTAAQRQIDNDREFTKLWQSK